jgi:hypothetical protein
LTLPTDRKKNPFGRRKKTDFQVDTYTQGQHFIATGIQRETETSTAEDANAEPAARGHLLYIKIHDNDDEKSTCGLLLRTLK